MGSVLRFLLLAILLPSCSLFRYTEPAGPLARPRQSSVPVRWDEGHELSVVTMNAKDMLWLSEDRRLRMDRIAELLVELNPDVVCLQEGFVSRDISLIREPLRDIGLRFAMDYPSGVVGSGLWILSRFPVRETYFKRFSKNGVFHYTRGGDWWAGKGVAFARLELSEDKFLDIYNTYMVCNLGPRELRAHRMDQARELAEFVDTTTPGSIPVIVLGDFNCGPKPGDECGPLGSQ
ncbi:MAG: sphingomyelin phosphodiesterase 2 [Planctomycetota bacterium]|jgi:sphingomyelin phosphodiesterase 2